MQPSGIESGVRLSRLCKALGHPARVLILRYLITRPAGCTCGELVAQLPLAQSTVSQHLRVLRAAGFVTAAPAPPRTIWTAAADGLDEFRRAALGLQP